MGRPRVKQIDDSQPVEEVKKTPQPKAAKKPADSLVAQLQEELGITKESDSAELKTDKTAQLQADQPAETEKPKAEKVVTKEQKQKTEHKKVTIAQQRSKKYQEKVASLEKELTTQTSNSNESPLSYKTQVYKLPEAIEMVKKLSYSKFDGTLEAHVNTAQTGIRGLVSLPFAAGKQLKIVAFGKGAEDSGADVAGSDETIDEISKGKVNFDLVITTPEWMPKLAKVAKNLGPKGLMPNPKNGTITDDLQKAVDSFQAGKTEYRTESKTPVMHLSLGKLSQPNEELEANVKMLLTTLGKSRIRKVTLAPTIGASVKLDLASI